MRFVPFVVCINFVLFGRRTLSLSRERTKRIRRRRRDGNYTRLEKRFLAVHHRQFLPLTLLVTFDIRISIPFEASIPLRRDAKREAIISTKKSKVFNVRLGGEGGERGAGVSRRPTRGLFVRKKKEASSRKDKSGGGETRTGKLAWIRMSLVATDYAPVYLIDTLPSPYRHDLKSAAPPISRPQNRLDLSTDRIFAILFPLRGRTHVYFPENFSSPPQNGDRKDSWKF